MNDNELWTRGVDELLAPAVPDGKPAPLVEQHEANIARLRAETTDGPDGAGG